MDSVGRARASGPAGERRALVIGASMAGLLAARVLADHFDRVTIVERDRLPQGPDVRKGVPQARHIHVLLRRGRQILEQLFPGLDADLVAAGAATVDWTADSAYFAFGGWKPRFQSGLVTRFCSRALLEWSVRRHVQALGQISIREECGVTGLLAETAGGSTRITGVRLRPRIVSEAPASGATEELLEPADLVVDASGRSSRAPEWLAALGFPAPRETAINAFVGYASRVYAPPPGLRADWKLLLLQATPPIGKRGGVIVPVEGGRWIVSLLGAGRDYPPTEEAAYLEFARSLPSPILYEAIRDAQPLSPIAGYRRTENTLRHYERVARRPEGFVVTGDAVCAFNPVYGQGMSAGAMGAIVLDGCLREQRRHRPDGDLTGLARRFQARLARSNATIWLLATGEDFRYRETEGGRPGPLVRLLHRYFDRVLTISTHSPRAHQAFLEVAHLITPPVALFQPGIAIPALLRGGSLRRGATAPAPGPVPAGAP